MNLNYFSFSGIIATILLSYLISNPVVNNTDVANTETSTTYYYELPVGSEEWSKEEFTDYMDNLGTEEQQELIKSHHVMSYLKEINKYDSVLKDMKKGSLFSKVALSEYLSKNQLAAMSSYKFTASANAGFGCQNYMISCYGAGSACTPSLRYIQVWYNCRWCYRYSYCRSNCGGPF